MSNATCSCTNCGQKIEFGLEYAGVAVECPHCAHDMRLVAPYYVTCRCQHCGRGIEFDANELADENSIVPCPHCGFETKLFTPSKRALYSESAWQRSLPATAIQKEKLAFCGCTWNGHITAGEALDALLQCAVLYPDMEAAWQKHKRDILKSPKVMPRTSGPVNSQVQARNNSSAAEAKLAPSALPESPPRREGFFAGGHEPGEQAAWVHHEMGEKREFPPYHKPSKRAAWVPPNSPFQEVTIQEVHKPAINFNARLAVPKFKDTASKPPQTFTLDMVRIDAIKNETKEVQSILSSLMQDEAEKSIVLPKTLALPSSEIRNNSCNGNTALQPARFNGLDAAFHPVLERLLTRDSWPQTDFDSLAREFHFMPLNIFDTLNEWADEVLGDFILDGGDPLVLRRELIQKKAAQYG
jgi:DNA-directed RNA polymerase subunit RPC12/RpoP